MSTSKGLSFWAYSAHNRPLKEKARVLTCTVSHSLQRVSLRPAGLCLCLILVISHPGESMIHGVLFKQVEFMDLCLFNHNNKTIKVVSHKLCRWRWIIVKYCRVMCDVLLVWLQRWRLKAWLNQIKAEADGVDFPSCSTLDWFPLTWRTSRNYLENSADNNSVLAPGYRLSSSVDAVRHCVL